MDFILNKLLLIFVISNVYLGTEFDLPRNDLLILNNGEEIKCQVKSVAGNTITVLENNNERTFHREFNKDAARDMVESGVVKTKRYTGKLEYLDPEYLEIATSNGRIKIRKALLRKVIISQEPSFNL